jgi:hypothetical protein
MMSTEASQAAAGFAEADLTVHETRVRLFADGVIPALRPAGSDRT